ncbi:FAD-dependent oxidoreductase, partial [Candidatus Altiarchaeota archaeon]
LESREEMPAHDIEIEEAIDEGVSIEVSWGPKKIMGQDERVIGVEFMKCTSVLDEIGRFKPTFDEKETKMFEADTVILAVGQATDLSFLEKKLDVTDGRPIPVNPITLSTGLPGVFAGGDVVLGPATLIEAIVAGKKAAESIDRYLGG